jgi:hypothetical protein
MSHAVTAKNGVTKQWSPAPTNRRGVYMGNYGDVSCAALDNSNEERKHVLVRQSA